MRVTAPASQRPSSATRPRTRRTWHLIVAAASFRAASVTRRSQEAARSAPQPISASSVSTVAAAAAATEARSVHGAQPRVRVVDTNASRVCSRQAASRHASRVAVSALVLRATRLSHRAVGASGGRHPAAWCPKACGVRSWRHSRPTWESAVHASPSSQSRSASPAHAPALHVSPTVVSSPSSHGMPSGAAGSVQAPSAGSQDPCRWHWPGGAQSAGQAATARTTLAEFVVAPSARSVATAVSATGMPGAASAGTATSTSTTALVSAARSSVTGSTRAMKPALSVATTSSVLARPRLWTAKETVVVAPAGIRRLVTRAVTSTACARKRRGNRRS
jgi:hypothetical protein